MKVVPLSDLVEPVAKRDPRSDLKGPNFTYVDIGAVSQDTKQIEAPQEIECSEAPSRARQLIEQNDILVSTVRPNLNAVARVGREFKGAIASTGFSVLRPDQNKLSPDYLYHWVRTEKFISNMMMQATGQSYPAVSNKIIMAAKIPLPPLEEQKRIAGILDQADALRRLRTRALDKLNTLGQAIFHEMFGDKEIPSLAVEQLGDVQGGLQVSKKRDIYRRREPYLRVANVYRDQLELREIKTIGLTGAEAERTMLQSGDVMIVEGHGNPSEIGRTAVWNGEISQCVHQNHLIRFRPDQTLILPQFFSSYMNSATGRKHLTSSSRTTTGLNTISTRKVKDCVIPVPSIDRQHAFLAGYQSIAEQNSSFSLLLSTQQSLFASLQHRAFRGEL